MELSRYKGMYVRGLFTAELYTKTVSPVVILYMLELLGVRTYVHETVYIESVGYHSSRIRMSHNVE